METAITVSYYHCSFSSQDLFLGHEVGDPVYWRVRSTSMIERICYYPRSSLQQSGDRILRVSLGFITSADQTSNP